MPLVPIDSILAEGNIRRFWADDEHGKRLVDSIRSVGVIEPVIIVPLVHGGNGRRYRLVAGFRRYTAACEAGLDRIPAVVRRGLTGSQILEIQFVENLQRLDMNPIEEATAVRDYLKASGIDQLTAGRRLGRSSAWISQRLGMLRLPAEVQQMLSDGGLTVVHGAALIPLLGDQPEETIVRLAREGKSMGVGAWKAALTRMMRGAPYWVGGPRVRDLCTCGCACCVNHQHAGCKEDP